MYKQVQIQCGYLEVYKRQMGGCQGSKQVRRVQQAADQLFRKPQKSDRRPYQYIFQNWLKKIDVEEKFYQKYKRMCLPNYSVQQQRQVNKMLNYWGHFSIKDSLKFLQVQYQRYYKEVEVLSARVYGKFIQLIQKYQGGELKYDKTNQNEKFLRFLRGLTFSYNRYFFMKNQGQTVEPLRQLGSVEKTHQKKIESSSKQSQHEISAQVNNLLTQSTLHTIKKMYHFMVSIQLISLTEQRQISNAFILSLERIKTKDQKQLYCNTMKFPILQELMKKQEEMPLQRMKFLEEEMPNYYFYKTKFKSKLKNQKFQWDKYEELFFKWGESFQLLFPNHFQSRSNPKSSPLGYIEKRLFLLDEEVGLYLLISTYVYLNTIGITLGLQDFRFRVHDERKLDYAFKNHQTNSKVFMRMLSSLSITGFREIAIKLLLFINLCYSKKLIQISENELEILKVFSASLQAKEACFLEEENFPKAHTIFKKIMKVQSVNKEHEDIEQQNKFTLQLYEHDHFREEQELKTSEKSNNLLITNFPVNRESLVSTSQPSLLISVPAYKHNNRKLQIDSQLPKKLQLMAENIDLNEDIMNKIKRNILGGFTQTQMRSIFKLLEIWGSEKFDYTKIDQLIRQQYHSLYIKCDVLSARVYARAIQFIQKLQDNKEKDHIQQENYELLKQIRRKKEIDFSYDRFFFQKRFNPDKYDKHKVARSLLKLIKESRIQHLKTFFGFMQKIMLISINQRDFIGNVFMRRLQKMQDVQKKDLYFKSIQFKQLQTIAEINNDKGSPEKKENMIMETLKINCPNYYFYREEISKGKKRLHNLYRSYNTLEDRHDYIQWMFPNHYQSGFNSQALPMNYLEKRLFFDEQMGLKMLISIYIFFDFLGVRLDLNTFELSMCDPNRFRSAIVVHTHNHLRLMRILACLSIIGFRSIALKLIAFLEQNTQRGTIGERYRHQFEKNWEIYGNDRDGNPKAKAKDMCFLEDENFPQKHCILNMSKQIGQIYEQRVRQSGNWASQYANGHNRG